MKTGTDPLDAVDISDALHNLQAKKKPSVFRKSKYNAAPKENRTWQGKVYDSKLEMRMHQELLNHFAAEDIQTQVRFELQPSYCLDYIPDKQRAINYVADFVLGSIDQDERGNPVPGTNCMVLDAKGMVTSSFVTASKLFEYKFRIPVYAVKTIKQLQSLIKKRMSINEIDSKFIQASIPGTLFKVLGYVDSSGNKGNLTARVVGREGYVDLNKRSVEQLDEVVSKLIEGLTGEDLEDMNLAAKGVRSSCLKAAGLVEENTCGARVETVRLSKENLQQVTPELLMLDDDPCKLALLRLEVCDYEPLEVAPAKKASKSITALRNMIDSHLPIGSYRHRLNLYPGKYQELLILP